MPALCACDALVLHASDDVATALRRIEAGEQVRVRGPSADLALTAAETIPLCHKLALRDLERGALVRKYGEPIGRTTGFVGAGRHVHVHNLASRRARDAPAQGSG